MATGPVIDSKVLFRVEKAINIPSFQISFLHGEGWLRAVVVCRVDQAAAGAIKAYQP